MYSTSVRLLSHLGLSPNLSQSVLLTTTLVPQQLPARHPHTAHNLQVFLIRNQSLHNFPAIAYLLTTPPLSNEAQLHLSLLRPNHHLASPKAHIIHINTLPLKLP